jgi:hypothetical protein
MGNERLRAAMTAATVDVDTVANAASVDPKTVQRWLNGRLPHSRHRWKLVELLGEEEAYLWPEATNGRTKEASKAELLTLYPHRADIPRELWRHLFEHAEGSIDVLVYAGTFLHEQLPDLNDVLRSRAEAGLSDSRSAWRFRRRADSVARAGGAVRPGHRDPLRTRLDALPPPHR